MSRWLPNRVCLVTSLLLLCPSACRVALFRYLKDEPRDVGALMMMKKVHVKWVPVGVVGAIVPWNYPFHNVFNPMIATLMTGNSLVLKVTCDPTFTFKRSGSLADKSFDWSFTA